MPRISLMALASMATQEEWVPDPSHDFGQRLALVRQHFGWNVTEAARECGLDPASWTAWETEGRMPRRLVDVCERIANRSRCQFYWLLTGKEADLRQVTHGYGSAAHTGNVSGYGAKLYLFPGRVKETVEVRAA